MRVRALNEAHGWLFGASKSNYLYNNAAIVQNINTRLSSFTGNCFFDLEAGIDWFNLLGYKDRISLDLAISAIILKTPEVTGMRKFSSNLDPLTRVFSVRYTVQTVYSTATSTFIFDTSIG